VKDNRPTVVTWADRHSITYVGGEPMPALTSGKDRVQRSKGFGERSLLCLGSSSSSLAYV
jgi:hypothetical protein